MGVKKKIVENEMNFKKKKESNPFHNSNTKNNAKNSRNWMKKVYIEFIHSAFKTSHISQQQERCVHWIHIKGIQKTTTQREQKSSTKGQFSLKKHVYGWIFHILNDFGHCTFYLFHSSHCFVGWRKKLLSQLVVTHFDANKKNANVTEKTTQIQQKNCPEWNKIKTQVKNECIKWSPKHICKNRRALHMCSLYTIASTIGLSGKHVTFLSASCIHTQRHVDSF